MKQIALILVVMISLFLLPLPSNATIPDEESSGPIIDWPDNPSGVEIAWDGIYNGQTEQTFTLEVQVNDTNGVDTVILRFRWISQSDWMNVTAILVSGNSTVGCYQGNFTYDVWWNSTSHYPETEGDGGNFYYKVFANDTLGYWTEVDPIQYSGGYDMIYPPESESLGLVLEIAAIIGISVVAITGVVWWVRRR